MALGRKEAITLGREEGMTLGIDNSTISAIKNIMQSLNISSDQAMEILKVPDEKREYYKNRISSIYKIPPNSNPPNGFTYRLGDILINIC